MIPVVMAERCIVFVVVEEEEVRSLGNRLYPDARCNES